MNKRLYKKKSNVSQAALATARILLTAFTLGIIGMVVFYVVTEGWEAVIAWFAGKWFAMVAVIGIAGGAVILWALYAFKLYKKLTEGDDE